jgi:hypothetical protein
MTQPHQPTTLTTLLGAALASVALLFSTHQARAGKETVDSKITKNPEPIEQYEAGRGLITLEGPSGMFINPTSATLPRGAYTLQYCVLFVNSDTETVGQGLMTSYGITDWLELGAVGNYIIANRDKLNEREFGIGGPLVRIRLLKNDGWIPQLSIGAYGKYGTEVLQQTTAFLAAYERFPISDTGFVRSIAFHAGVRASWFHEDAPESNSVDGYFGGEIQLPARLYLVGEISTRGKNSGGNFPRIPYAFGIQWRLKAVNLSVAMIQNGTEKELGLYSGVGLGFAF